MRQLEEDIPAADALDRDRHDGTRLLDKVVIVAMAAVAAVAVYAACSAPAPPPATALTFSRECLDPHCLSEQ
ncbi:hypothetical protein [Duganella sp. Leaf126]|uniref:hypothetical protein n=1 Tax=Duganella sp. Leaf126 TaxID=1736266 RepID=UPI000B1E6979|nr:hypothetical protein [Duganella sp. Leaf126]